MPASDYDEGMYEEYYRLLDEIESIISKIDNGALDEITTIYEALKKLVD